MRQPVNMTGSSTMAATAMTQTSKAHISPATVKGTIKAVPHDIQEIEEVGAQDIAERELGVAISLLARSSRPTTFQS